MAVSKRLRFEVLRRDNHTCRYCGATAPDIPLTVDHVVPQALGGTDDPTNLVAACKDCNSGKSSMPADAAIVANVADDAIRWAKAMERVSAIRAQQRANDREIMDWFNAVWCNWSNWRDEPFPTPDFAFRSIPKFIDAGLTKDDLRDLVRVAMQSQSTDKWRYFCGCCWRRIREDQEMAASIITAEENDG